MPQIRVTQSVTLGTTNSYAWNSTSNWVGGVLPVSGDSVAVNQPAGSTGVSYDNLQLAGPLLRLTVPDQSPSPVLEIAGGITLLASGAVFNSGTIDVDSGAVMATKREASNHLTNVTGSDWLPNFLNAGTFAYQGPSANIYLTNAEPVWTDIATNDVTNFAVGDGLFLEGFVFSHGYISYAASVSGTTLTVDGTTKAGATTLLYELTNFGTAAGVTGITATGTVVNNPLTGVPNAFLELAAVVCFAAGTRIATERGDVAVEDLHQGDHVLTVGGGRRPVRWIGQRRLDLATQRRPESLYPIRIRRGAFAENVPQRDLLVSPDHCLFVDGRLVPAKLLVNGMTIAPDYTVPVVHYYHIELDRHDVLMAEGLAAESYLDTGNRDFFVNGGGPLTLHPELAIDSERLRWQDRLCAPLCLHSAECEPEWQRLAARAEALGYRPPTPMTTEDPDLHLLAGDRAFRPVAVEGDRYVFVLPEGAADVRIASRSGVPVTVNRHADDWRRLGVAVGRIGIRIGEERIEIPADHPDLSQGWHPAERDARGLRRWTDGNAVLPLGLAAGEGAAMVEILLVGTTSYTDEQDTTARLVA